MQVFQRKKEPDTGHPVVRFIFAEINRQQVSYDQLVDRSGYSIHGIMKLRRQRGGTFALINALVESLGYEIYVRPKRET